MRLLIIGLLVTLASCQSNNDVDEAADDFWGSLPSPESSSTTESSTQRKPSTIVPPISATDKSTTEKTPCQCVPYNLCNSSYYGAEVNNAVYTGFGDLDPRGGEEDECPIRGEVCCEIPVAKPTPDPAKVKGCGQRNLNGIGPNVSGASTQFGEFPWVVALLDADDHSYVGVGVLINPEVVMTVAHIAVNHTSRGLRARAGEWDLRNTNEIYYHQEKRVKEIYIHEKFDNRSFINDIALLRLDHPFKVTEHVNIICMPERGYVARYDCLANGWGKDKFGPGGTLSPIMKKVDLNKVNSPECNESLKKTRLGPDFNLDESFICAVGFDGQDMCEGDGGGPLACPNYTTRSLELVGLVSYGIGCGEMDLPAVYTNVELFTDWAENKFKDWGLNIEDSYAKKAF